MSDTPTTAPNRQSSTKAAVAELSRMASEVAAPLPVDEEDREGVEESVVLTATGWLRATLPDGTVLRLRRPFLGELKRLRLALEAMEDELEEESNRAQAAARVIDERVKRLEAEEGTTPEELAEARAQGRRESKAVARQLTTLGDELRVGWWRKAVTMLTPEHLELDEDEDKLPGWTVDPMFVHKVLVHWRSVPLARG